MHDLEKHISNLSIKGGGYEEENWKVCDKEFSVHDIWVAIKDWLPSSMQDELEESKEDYCSLANEYWCDLLSTIKTKDNR